MTLFDIKVNTINNFFSYRPSCLNFWNVVHKLCFLVSTGSCFWWYGINTLCIYTDWTTDRCLWTHISMLLSLNIMKFVYFKSLGNCIPYISLDDSNYLTFVSIKTNVCKVLAGVILFRSIHAISVTRSHWQNKLTNITA